LLTASAATGQMVFLPLMASMVGSYGWRLVAFLVSAVALLAIPLVWLLLPEGPSAIGQKMVGQTSETADDGRSKRNPLAIALDALRTSVRMPDFWLLFMSFFVCGLSTNGYIGTQFIAMCNDYGINEVKGASILAAMGMLDLVGTTLSGWLSDRYNPRVLLFWYYGLRGLALIFLPYAFGLQYYGLAIFAIFYGLDWIATVPPTVRLANDVFGRLAAPIVFGWIVAGHQLGAATATTVAGYMRATLGNYTLSSIMMGVACLIGAVLVLRIKGHSGAQPQPASA